MRPTATRLALMHATSWATAFSVSSGQEALTAWTPALISTTTLAHPQTIQLFSDIPLETFRGQAHPLRTLSSAQSSVATSTMMVSPMPRSELASRRCLPINLSGSPDIFLGTAGSSVEDQLLIQNPPIAPGPPTFTNTPITGNVDAKGAAIPADFDRVSSSLRARKDSTLPLTVFLRMVTWILS